MTLNRTTAIPAMFLPARRSRWLRRLGATLAVVLVALGLMGWATGAGRSVADVRPPAGPVAARAAAPPVAAGEVATTPATPDPLEVLGRSVVSVDAPAPGDQTQHRGPVATRSTAHVAYGPDSLQYVDVYRSSVPGPRPVILYLHGGGWIGGEPTEVPKEFLREASRGYTIVTVAYRFAPEHPFPTAVNDVQDAMRYLVQHAVEFTIDPAAIVVVGFSAGGNLAGMIGTVWNEPGFHSGPDVRPAAWASFSGILDIAYFHSHSIWANLTEQYLPFVDDASMAAASPLSHVDGADPGAFIVSGANDPVAPGGPTPVEVAGRYAAAGRTHDVWIQTTYQPGCDQHGPFCGTNWGAFNTFIDASVAGTPLATIAP